MKTTTRRAARRFRHTHLAFSLAMTPYCGARVKMMAGTTTQTKKHVTCPKCQRSIRAGA